MVNCGQCNQQFQDDAGYLAHVCPVTGVDPTHPATMGPDFAEMQKAALQRGLEQAQAEGDQTQAAVNQKAIEDLSLQGQ